MKGLSEMDLVIFGTGQLYEQLKNQIRDDVNVVAIIDNDIKKQGTYIDGVKIYAPNQIHTLSYDYIFTLSGYHLDMKNQLESLGVDSKKILNMYYLEKVLQLSPTQCYGNYNPKSASKKILVVSHALNSTGAQNVLFTAVVALKKMGYDTVVFSRSDGKLREKFLEEDIPVVINRDFSLEIKEVNELVEWADLIIANTIWIHEIVNKLSRSGKKLLWWLHETTGLKYVSKEWMRYITSIPTISIYVISDLVKRLILQYYNENFEMNILSCGLIPKKEMQRQAFDREKIIFSIIGTLDSSVKGQDVFVEAIEKLDEKYKNTSEFWIVGAGQLKKHEVEKIKSIDCIKIKGEIENSKIGELYEDIDVVVSCSRIEALSVVIAEGCMYERMVIVSDAAGIADYIDDGVDGFVFESENSEQLADLIKWTIDEREKARDIAKKSYEVYMENFTIDKYRKNLKHTVEILLGE